MPDDALPRFGSAWVIWFTQAARSSAYVTRHGRNYWRHGCAYAKPCDEYRAWVTDLGTHKSQHAGVPKSFFECLGRSDLYGFVTEPATNMSQANSCGIGREPSGK